MREKEYFIRYTYELHEPNKTPQLVTSWSVIKTKSVLDYAQDKLDTFTEYEILEIVPL